MTHRLLFKWIVTLPFYFTQLSTSPKELCSSAERLQIIYSHHQCWAKGLPSFFSGFEAESKTGLTEMYNKIESKKANVAET